MVVLEVDRCQSPPPLIVALPHTRRPPHTLHTMSDVTRMLDAVERGETLKRAWAEKSWSFLSGV